MRPCSSSTTPSWWPSWAKPKPRKRWPIGNCSVSQRIKVGTRPEIIAQRKAEIDRATADLTLAQQTYNRTKQLAADKFAPQSKLDEDTDALTLTQRRLDQAKLAYDEAVRGFTAEEHQIAEANVDKAAAKVDTIKALVDQLTITAPIASQVYQIPVEEGEVVTPGLPLLLLVDLSDTWLGFSLHEDLIAGLKVGDRFTVNIPALRGRPPRTDARATRGRRCRRRRRRRGCCCGRRARSQIADQRAFGRGCCPARRGAR